MSIAPGTRLGVYEITAAIGAGGMGEVYRARDTRLQRDVAIKTLPEISAKDSDRLARFDREAQVLASLNHPHIAHIYGVEESDGVRALVMELVDGDTLADRIARGPIAVDEALQLARQIAGALAAAHERGIVHRDLKPANIKVTAAGEIKVLDFGLAKAFGRAGGESKVLDSPTMSLAATMQGVILGTAGYMAPEQARGKSVDPRVDIWAFGVVLYEMLAGRQLFAGETLTDTLAAVVEREVSLDVIPPHVRPLLRACLQKDPQRRLRDIADAPLLLDAPHPIQSATHAEERRSTWRFTWPALAAVFSIAAAALGLVHFRETPVVASEPVRFQIESPPLSSGVDFYMAMSPNGRTLAYTATGENGVSQLWIRTMDTLESRPVPGTENAVSLFWSPDSRFVGFGQGNRLKRVDISGGLPPVTVCEIQGGVVGMGTWSRDGIIVFGGRGSGGLKRVAAAGGIATDASTLGDRETNHSFPVFLPDGRHFLYLRISPDEDVIGAYVGSIDLAPSEQPRNRLLAVRTGVAYVAADERRGHVIFLRDGAVMAQPFDANRLQLEDAPVPVVDQVGAAGSGAFFAVSSGALAYRAGGGAGRQLAWFDRKGTQLGQVVARGNFNEIALSPEGTRVANFQDADAGQIDVWVLDLARAANTRLTFEPGAERYPVWARDGQTIAYAMGVGGGSIYRKPANGSGDPELLVKIETGGAPQDWSPDGRYLLYAASDPKSAFDLWILPMTAPRTPVPFMVTPFVEAQATFSPDGSWVAYLSTESGRGEVYVRPFSPPGDPAPTGKWMISNGGGAQPRWRGDGKEILYLSPTGTLMSVTVDGSGPALRTGVPQPLFDTAIYGAALAQTFTPRWDLSRDGQRVLVNRAATGTRSSSITILQNWQRLLRPPVE